MKIKSTARVEEVGKVESHRKNIDKDLWYIKLKDAEGTTTMAYKTPEEIQGFNPDEIVDITITTSQTSLDQFEKTKENAKSNDE